MLGSRIKFGITSENERLKSVMDWNYVYGIGMSSKKNNSASLSREAKPEKWMDKKGFKNHFRSLKTMNSVWNPIKPSEKSTPYEDP